MTRHSVNSSNIASVGHDPSTGTLEVEFKNGHVWRYTGVSIQDHNDLISAGSIGKHFHSRIKNNYTGSRA